MSEKGDKRGENVRAFRAGGCTPEEVLRDALSVVAAARADGEGVSVVTIILRDNDMIPKAGRTPLTFREIALVMAYCQSEMNSLFAAYNSVPSRCEYDYEGGPQ